MGILHAILGEHLQSDLESNLFADEVELLKICFGVVGKHVDIE